MPSISTRKSKLLRRIHPAGLRHSSLPSFPRSPPPNADAHDDEFRRTDRRDADLDVGRPCACRGGVERLVDPDVEGLLRRRPEQRAVAPDASKLGDGAVQFSRRQAVGSNTAQRMPSSIERSMKIIRRRTLT